LGGSSFNQLRSGEPLAAVLLLLSLSHTSTGISSFQVEHHTMSSLLAKRISSHFFSSSPLHHHHHFAILTPLFRQHLSSKPKPKPSSLPQKEIPFLADYLVSSFGFSPHRALKVSAYGNLAGIKSLDRPEAVIKFLGDTGLSDTQIKSVVSLQPLLLSWSVDKTLKPRVREWVENGFSEKLMVQFIRYCPGIGAPVFERYY
jgi:mTERF